MEMMHELLEDEVSYAIEHRNFANLFSSPAAPDVWVKWMEIARKKGATTTPLAISARELKLDDSEVEAEIELASTG